MSYPVLELAKYIVSKCIKEKHPITNLQLQKILYCVQRDFLQKLDKLAFPESIEAWAFGAVVPEVYYYFSSAGAMHITLCGEPVQSISDNERKLIDSITESKRDKTPWDFANETNKQGGAWDTVFDGGKGNKSVIPTEKIQTLG